MIKRTLATLFIVLLVIGSIVGCGDQNEKVGENDNVTIGELNYDVVNPGELTDEDIKSWYNENRKTEGLYTKTVDDARYVLLSAGEQMTGGYSVEIVSVEGKENQIVVNGRLNVPGEDEMVTEAITYPNTLIKIYDTSREVILGNLQVPEPAEEVNNDNESELYEMTGTFTGRIDSNTIEMKVKGEYVAPRLSDEVRTVLDEDENYINVGDIITIIYSENEHGQYIVHELIKEPGYNLSK